MKGKKVILKVKKEAAKRGGSLKKYLHLLIVIEHECFSMFVNISNDFCNMERSTLSNNILALLVSFVFIVFLTDGKAAEKELLPVSDNWKHTFHLPGIPDTLINPQHRAKYLVEHYWDHFNFADTSSVYVSDSLEPVFAEYIGIFPYTTDSVVSFSIKKWMKQAELNRYLLPVFCDLSEKYLYDTHSPMRNEEFYISFLEYALESKKMDEVHRSYYRSQWISVRKNRADSLATDFIYTLASGKRGSLFKLNSKYTLLFFNDPDCESCISVKKQLETSPTLVALQVAKDDSRRQLTVLSVYTENEVSLWKEHVSEYPSAWINGYDKDQVIRNKALYDLNELPCLYLLDKEKRIIQKETSIERIEQYLKGI